MKKTECNYNLKSNKCISLFTGLSLEIALSGGKHIGIKEAEQSYKLILRTLLHSE